MGAKSDKNKNCELRLYHHHTGKPVLPTSINSFIQVLLGKGARRLLGVCEDSSQRFGPIISPATSVPEDGRVGTQEWSVGRLFQSESICIVAVVCSFFFICRNTVKSLPYQVVYPSILCRWRSGIRALGMEAYDLGRRGRLCGDTVQLQKFDKQSECLDLCSKTVETKRGD